MKLIKLVTTSIVLLGFSNVAFATTKVQNCISQSGDYSNNAYDVNTTACNKTAQWQRLGTAWNADTSARTETNTSTDDGVSWETLINGNWETNGELVAGNSVRFVFDVTRSTVGNHKYDELKSWVDWNQDGIWDESEDIINERWWKNKDSEGNIQNYHDLSSSERVYNWGGSNYRGDGTVNWDLYDNVNSSSYIGSINSVDTTATFTSGIFSIPDTLTEIWLRARVVCENSLQNYSDGMNLLSYGYQDQGEVEDYKLAVKTNGGGGGGGAVPVPEPSTLFIFAIALFAFASSHRKSIK